MWQAPVLLNLSKDGGIMSKDQFKPSTPRSCAAAMDWDVTAKLQTMTMMARKS